MAVYAAMVPRGPIDWTIIAALRRLDQLEDTLILFLSDNGGCADLMAEEWLGEVLAKRAP
jgi:arylsulfatase